MVVVDRLIPRKAFHTFHDIDSTADMIRTIHKKNPQKPTVFTLDSAGGDPELAQMGASMRASFCQERIPAFPSMERAARALKHLYDYHFKK